MIFAGIQGSFQIEQKLRFSGCNSRSEALPGFFVNIRRYNYVIMVRQANSSHRIHLEKREVAQHKVQILKKDKIL